MQLSAAITLAAAGGTPRQPSQASTTSGSTSSSSSRRPMLFFGRAATQSQQQQQVPRRRSAKKRPPTPGAVVVDPLLRFTDHHPLPVPVQPSSNDPPTSASPSATPSAPQHRKVTNSIYSTVSVVYPIVPPGLEVSSRSASREYPVPSSAEQPQSEGPTASLAGGVHILQTTQIRREIPSPPTGISSFLEFDHQEQAAITRHPLPNSKTVDSDQNTRIPQLPSPHQTSSPSGPTSSFIPHDEAGDLSLDPQDRPNTGHSTVPDSPNTRAIMKRLLSAPDRLRGDDGLSDGDTITFAFACGMDDNDDDNDVESCIRDQRDQSKIKKLLGSFGEADPEPAIGRPRQVREFWDDADSRGEGVTGPAAKGEGLDGCSPVARDFWSSGSALPSPVRGTWNTDSRRPSVSQEEGKKRRVPAKLHKSPEGRHYQHQHHRDFNSVQSRSVSSHRSPPMSPTLQSPPPRVHAPDALQPNQPLKRSYSTSSAITGPSSYREPVPTAPQSYVPSSMDSFLHISRANSPRNSPTTSKDPSRAPSPNISTVTTAASGTAVGPPPSDIPSVIAPPRTSSRFATSPAAAIVDDYKRRDRTGQDSALKETKRLSAVLWMREQARLVKGKGSSGSVSPRSVESSSNPGGSGSEAGSASGGGTGARATSTTTTTMERQRRTKEERVLGLNPRRNVSLPTNSPNPMLTFDLPAPSGFRSKASSRSGQEVSSLTGGHPRAPTPDDEEEGAAPYYTVVGSRSSRVVPADAADGAWNAYDIGYWDSSILTRQLTDPEEERIERGGFASHLGHALSKKRSDKWKKGADGAVESQNAEKDERRPRNRLRGKSFGEVSTTNGGRTVRGQSVDKKEKQKDKAGYRRSFSLMMDKFPGGEELGAIAASAPPSSANTSRAATPRKDTTSGKKFWKFVKRIGSNGGLRDKYNNVGPPSEPLPKSAASRNGSPVGSDVNGSEVLAQLLSSARRESIEDLSSSSSPTKLTASPKPNTSGVKQPSSSADSHAYPLLPRHLAGATRSSTPASSDHGSPSVFRRTHSTRSSLSSFGDVPPPLPQHCGVSSSRTMSPVDRGQHSDGGLYRAPAARRSVSQPTVLSGALARTPPDEDWTRTDLRHPPPPKALEAEADGLFKPDEVDLSDFERSGSPGIPEFSTANVINTFAARKPAVKGVKNVGAEGLGMIVPAPVAVPPPPLIATTTSLPPPPRPARNARRPPPSSQIRPSSGDSNGKASADNTNVKPGYAGYGPRPPLTSSFGPIPPFHGQPAASDAPVVSVVPQLPQLPFSSSSSRNSLVPSGRAEQQPPVVGFREVEASGGSDLKSSMMSEEEKAAKWDALLEKSALAGGTLHLTIGAESHLESDQLTIASASVQLDL